MKKLIALAAGCLWTVTALGQDLYACLGPDLVRSIVAPTTTNNDISITAAVPQELANVTLPREVEWIGVIDGEMRMIAAFKTALPLTEAQTVLEEPLAAAGWTVTPSPTMMTRGSTFVFGESARVPGAQLCVNDRPGNLFVRDVDGARYINLTWTGASGEGSCRVSSRVNLRPFPNPATDQRPTLRFPAGSSQPNGGFSASGSDSDYRVSTQFVSEDSPGEIIDVLGRQLMEQGWVPDSTWSGRRGAGGNWVRENDSGARVLASLEILSRADDYAVEFRLREF